MPPTPSSSFRFNDQELRILKKRSEDLDISQADLLRELIWFDGICPSSHSLTTEIRNASKDRKDAMVKRIADALESGEKLAEPSFKAVVKEVAREILLEIKDHEDLEKPVAKEMIKKLFPDI